MITLLPEGSRMTAMIDLDAVAAGFPYQLGNGQGSLRDDQSKKFTQSE